MKITIKNKLEAFGLSSVRVGDFFRFANGKNTNSVYMCLTIREEGYSKIKVCRNLGERCVEQLWVTNKERYVVFVEPVEIVFEDTTQNEMKFTVNKDET